MYSTTTRQNGKALVDVEGGVMPGEGLHGLRDGGRSCRCG